MKILTLTLKTGRSVLKEISAAYDEAQDIWAEKVDPEKEQLKTQLEEVRAEAEVFQQELMAARDELLSRDKEEYIGPVAASDSPIVTMRVVPPEEEIHMGLDNDPGDEDEEAGYV